MKLRKCYIADFGKLHNYTYEFKDGLNTICEENGWGKTTFGAFIKSMFYGLEYNPRKKLAENERKKYYPWQGGNFGGSIEFDVGDREYKLERYFGKRDKEDTFCLYDRRTGLISADYSENIGEELFQIDAASYERSTYIPQNSITVSMTDSINAKLSNLVENGNDINNYENAYSRLEEHLKEYKKTGGRGKIPLLKEQIFAKQEEIAECENKAKGMAEIEAQIEEQKEKRRELEHRREELRAAVVAAGNEKEQLAKQEHYDSLKKREAEIAGQLEPYAEIFTDTMPDEPAISEISQQIEAFYRLKEECAQAKLNEADAALLSELDEFFAAGCPDKPEIEMYLGERREYDAVKEEIIRIQARMDMLKMQKSQEEIRKQEEERKRQEEQQKLMDDAQTKAAIWQRVFVTAGILFVAAGIVAILFVKAAGISLFVVGILCLILAVTRKSGATKHAEKMQESKEQILWDGTVEEACQKEIDELLDELSKKEEQQRSAKEHYQAFIRQFPFRDTAESAVQLLTKLESKADEYHRLSVREQALKEQEQALAAEAAEKEQMIRQRLEAIHVKYSMEENLRMACELLQKDVSEYERLTKELARSRQELCEFAESNKDAWQKMTEQSEDETEASQRVSLEELQQSERQCEAEIEAVDAKIHSYRKDMDAHSVIVDRKTEFEDELAGLTAQLQEAEYRAGILEKTMQYLKEAKESFSTHYMGKMRQGFLKYADMLSGGGKEIQLDVQLNARIEAEGALRENEYFSTGNRDFIGICIRLALVEALFTGEKPFIILDDPFVNLDDVKVSNARKLLAEIADEYQVVYLVCHSSRV